MINEKEIEDKNKIDTYDEYIKLFFPDKLDSNELLSESAEEIGSRMAKQTISHIKKMLDLRK